MSQDNQEQRVKITYDTNAKKAAKDVNKLDQSIKSTKDTTKSASKANKENNQSLENLGGGIGGAISGMKGLIKQMWLLVANPIGAVIAAVVLAVTALYKAFTSTKAGGEQLEQVMDGLGAVMDVLRDRVLKIGGAIVKFFTGDWAGAVNDAKAAVNGFGDEVAAEFKKAADARKSLQEVADTMRDLGVQRAKLNRDLVEAKEIIESETASYGEKLAAIEKVKKAEQEQTESELAAAQKKLDAIRAQNALSDSSSEALQAEADAEARLYAIQQKSAEDRIKNIKLIKKAEAEETARKKQLAAEAAAIEKEKEAKAKEAEKIRLEKEKEAEKIRLEEEKEAEKKREEARKLELERLKKQADEELKIAEALFKQKQALEDAKIGIIQKSAQLIAQIFGKSKKVQKAAVIAENAAGIAKMIIDNNRANVGALATPQAIASSGASAVPVIAANNITTALGVASTIAATAKALKELGGGSAGSAPTTGGGGGSRSASAAPQVNFQASPENQITQSIERAKEEAPIIEAFITETSVTSAQDAARKRELANSI